MWRGFVLAGSREFFSALWHDERVRMAKASETNKRICFILLFCQILEREQRDQPQDQGWLLREKSPRIDQSPGSALEELKNRSFALLN